jgi:UDP-N-acetylglucosamine--N-acetylmuramyl-(pentapeptide) pyrophosphoryl-undecaprenol N-acetylglucosamine transferase
MRRVLIAVGGTGGHLFPAQQLREQLPDAEVHFAGHELKTSPFFNRNIPFTEIPSSNRNPWTLFKGLLRSLRLLLRFKPHVVVGFGSFHSIPLLLAAVVLRKKIVLFEANYSLGKANKLFAPFASKIAFQFPFPHKKAVYVPLLPWKKIVSSSKYFPDPERTTLLVFGGSQGASFINKTFCEAAKLLQFPFRVIHFTGKEDPNIQYDVPSIVKPFESDMASAYEVADLVVCRCGAGTVAELIRYQKPAILIPYPFAYDHQKKNGELIQSGARILLQSETNAEKLAEEINLMKNELQSRKKALAQLKFPQTVELGEVIRTCVPIS